MEKKISFEDIIYIVKNAMIKSLVNSEIYGDTFYFTILDKDSIINIKIYSDKLVIFGDDFAYYEQPISITERDQLDLKSLSLDIKELNSKRCIDLINKYLYE